MLPCGIPVCSVCGGLFPTNMAPTGQPEPQAAGAITIKNASTSLM
jgi:hypothetical protein